MAAAVLAGVNPIHGLYAAMIGPVVGGLTTSSMLMVVTTTSASALAAGSAIRNVPVADRGAALLVVALLAGLFMLVAGIARLGRYTRFVSHSVMTGFLSGVAVNIATGQLQGLTGTADVAGTVNLVRGLDVLLHPWRWNLVALACGVTALALMALLNRTRLAPGAAVAALAVPTAACIAFGAESVLRVADRGPIPNGLPLPALPDFGLMNLDLIGGSMAVAAIVLVQGAGVAETAPNPDGSTTRISGDFVGQGLAGVAAGVFGGMPVGGSVGRTSLSVAAGARTRWAAIMVGLWIVAIIALGAGLVGQVVAPTLAAVLIYASVKAMRFQAAAMVLRTGRISQIAIVSTFVATLLLPMATAVGLGVVVSLLLQVNREALDLRVVELSPDGEGNLTEHPAPASLTNHSVTLLDVYGSLFYAGAKTLEARLPDPANAVDALVILRLRGRTMLGATSLVVMERYASRLAAHGGRLYLCGVDPHLMAQFARSGLMPANGPVRLFEATSTIGGSSRQALEAANDWLVHRVSEADETEPS